MKVKFSEVFEDVTRKGRKLPTSLYNESGKYPIFDQGQNEIAGYTDEVDGLYTDVPAYIFGDHTRVIKYVDTPCFLGADGVKLLKAKDKTLNPRFLYYALQSIDIPNTGYNRHFKWLKESTIKIVDADEQLNIVKRLEKIEQLIFLRKQQLATLDELVKARFVEMFGNPVANEKRWNQVHLSSCVKSIDTGKSFVCDSAARQGDWPAVLKLSAATYGYYRPEENKAMLDKNQFIEEAAVHTGDLLFTRKNTPELVGMCAYVYDTPNKLMMPDLIFRLNTTERCNKVFLWKLINHELFRSCIQTIATGSAKSMSNISKERLLDLEIILPPIDLQNQFAAFVQSTDQTKSAIQASLNQLETLKKSLMQDYFG